MHDMLTSLYAVALGGDVSSIANRTIVLFIITCISTKELSNIVTVYPRYQIGAQSSL